MRLMLSWPCSRRSFRTSCALAGLPLAQRWVLPGLHQVPG